MDRQRTWILTSALLAALGTLWLLPTGAIPEERAPAVKEVGFDPAQGAAGRVESLPKGEVLLYSVLQGLADLTGSRVVLKTADPPETKLLLSRAVDPLDEKSAMRTLEGAGFEVKQSRRGGKTVYDVEKAPLPPRPKGKLKPSGSGPAPDAPPSAADPQGAAAQDRPEGSRSIGGPRLYELHEGAGSRYVVILETDSREEAEEALKLFEAHRKSRSTKKTAAKEAAEPAPRRSAR
jgi:hypothetical protein